MNIQDVDARNLQLPDIGTTDRLMLVFAQQASHIDKYAEIERKNGFYYPEKRPVCLHDRRDQCTLKDFAWRVVEELAEAVDAACERGWESDHAREEVADALHFLVEFALLTGETAETIVTPWDQMPYYNIHNHKYDWIDPRADLFGHLYGMGKFHAVDYARREALSSDRMEGWILTEFIRRLGMVCHLLKNKPWKTSHMLTDQVEFRKRLREAFIFFFAYAYIVGISADDLFTLYFRKSAVNSFRQRSDY